jgi:hypothetical protein
MHDIERVRVSEPKVSTAEYKLSEEIRHSDQCTDMVTG